MSANSISLPGQIPLADRRHTACLGLGSNTDPERHLQAALAHLESCLTVQGVSTAWQSPDQDGGPNDYLNAAVLATTDQGPSDLVRTLKDIERSLGRSVSDGASIAIDIDLLIYDGFAQRDELWSRPYWTVSVAELIPGFQSQGMPETIGQIARRMAGTAGLRRRPDVFTPNSEIQIESDR